VTYEGRWHRITAAGLNPMPVQRPIPVWFGGGATDRVLRRIARLGDGWIAPMLDYRPDAQGKTAIDRFRELALEEGRDPGALGIEARIHLTSVDAAVQEAETWTALGVSHVCLNTMSSGCRTVDDHIGMIRRFRKAFAG
jgi:alkanesulfonate monooxygenase SsuD/methylene tetrahydromethanopterin reductase-like flavin-dependent oxidoreductase (luciferase family)